MFEIEGKKKILKTIRECGITAFIQKGNDNLQLKAGVIVVIPCGEKYGVEKEKPVWQSSILLLKKS